MDTKVVLVEYEAKKEKIIYASSGLLFSKKFVFITANALMSVLKEEVRFKEIDNVQAGVLHRNLFSFENHLTLNVLQKSDDEQKLLFQTAKVCASFVCMNIKTSERKILYEWAIDTPEEREQNKDAMGLFFILEIQTNIPEHLNLEDALQQLWCNLMKEDEFCIGQDIFIESAPFANRSFLPSFSQGIVSNILGKNSCFILSDCPTVPGSEGSPMYIRKRGQKHLMGIVLASVTWWKGEWIGLTLGISMHSILKQLVPASTKTMSNEFLETNCSKLISSVSKSLVQVICGSSWGTGIVFNKKKGIVVTNSHVVEPNGSIYIRWGNFTINAEIIFKTPDYKTYDLALIKCNPMDIANLTIEDISVCYEPLKIGDSVYAAGYSLFSAYVRANPTVTKGHVSQTHVSMVKTTTSIHPGASGGAILRSNGKLVAIIVCNAKLGDKGVAYPRISLGIPILAVYPILKKYLRTDDLGVLQQLQTENSSLSKPWNFLSGKL